MIKSGQANTELLHHKVHCTPYSVMTMMMLWVAVGACALATSSAASITFPSHIASSMVVQRGAPFDLQGVDTPNAKVCMLQVAFGFRDAVAKLLQQLSDKLVTTANCAQEATTTSLVSEAIRQEYVFLLLAGGEWHKILLSMCM